MQENSLALFVDPISIMPRQRGTNIDNASFKRDPSITSTTCDTKALYAAFESLPFIEVMIEKCHISHQTSTVMKQPEPSLIMSITVY